MVIEVENWTPTTISKLLELILVVGLVAAVAAVGKLKLVGLLTVFPVTALGIVADRVGILVLSFPIARNRALNQERLSPDTEREAWAGAPWRVSGTDSIKTPELETVAPELTFAADGKISAIEKSPTPLFVPETGTGNGANGMIHCGVRKIDP